MSDIVKCPICNVKVPFSLPMHMHMVHGPGAKLLDEAAGETVVGNDVVTHGHGKEKRRGPRPDKQRPRKGGFRRRGR